MKLVVGVMAVITAALVVPIVLLTSGPARSVQAVCRVWDTDGLALHNQFSAGAKDASADPFGELGNLIAAPGQVADLMSKMAAVAPSDIEPDFNQLADALKQSHDSSNPVAGLLGAVTVAAETEEPSRAVNTFLAQNCGIPSTAGGGS